MRGRGGGERGCRVRLVTLLEEKCLQFTTSRESSTFVGAAARPYRHASPVDEGVSYLDAFSLRSARSDDVNPADGMHPDQLLGLYIHSMVFTLLGVE